MFLFKNIQKLQVELSKIDKSKSIGFVPTMGALHLAHQSLIKKAVAENDFVVVSIFINPLQFGEHEDFDQYPRSLEADSQICETLGVKVLFAPSIEEMAVFQADTTLVIPPPTMTEVLCGKYRKGHFEGVATIVTKLLNIVRPTVAYFGQKDAQQLAIIRRLVKDLYLDVTIKSCPIIREESGLAFSSRNQYLTPQQKQDATLLSKSLSKAQQAFNSGEHNTNKLLTIVEQEIAKIPTLKLQYAQIVEPDTLKPLTKITKRGLLAIACYVGGTRLIDNVILELKQPIIAIDGPAGAGKSTISRRVAAKLGLIYLDTGAMYRAITWLIMEENIDINDQETISSLVQTANLELLPASDLQTPTAVKINNQDVTMAIRTSKVSAKVSVIASQATVREKLVQLQQEWAKKGGLVAEGRDIGTNVFPDAQLKIFLTASVAERARRRFLDLQNQGEKNIDMTTLQQQIEQRDYLDSNRDLSPLQKADDAIEVNTDGLTIAEVTDKILNLYQQTQSIS